MYTKLPKLSLAVQMMHLRKHYPTATCSVKRSCLRWVGEVHPTPLSDRYLLELVYKIEEVPRVKVLSPVLQRRDDLPPPHMYSEDRLCLYLPRTGEWSREMVIATTIVPWASEWCMYYEIWLATGEWRGGGVHPGERHKKQDLEDAA
ncbi:MAG: hypothetical protein KJZ54_14980 [Phycisphaerales bacterium]|nr:hypothetical protein [Phycisphaerales bacterium]